ncbi:MAG: FHA domain-containing protein [Deltaproteobacteria bacterium]|nr:FHA domain-containing protein [Deltaproteobacteria bacterium]
MSDNGEKTIRTDQLGFKTPAKGKSGLSSTLEIFRKTFIGRIPTEQHAFLEIMGEKKEKIKLGEEEFLIGRIPECDIQLMVENVSREHARIIYRNEEYQIEDLGSTNGIYVNGIKVEKCILRSNDLIEIGGVKMLFSEERIRQEP